MASRFETIGELGSATHAGGEALAAALRAVVGAQTFAQYRLWAIRQVGPPDLQADDDVVDVALPTPLPPPLFGHDDLLKDLVLWSEVFDAARNTGENGVIANEAEGHYQELDRFRQALNALIARWNALQGASPVVAAVAPPEPLPPATVLPDGKGPTLPDVKRGVAIATGIGLGLFTLAFVVILAGGAGEGGRR